VSEHKVVLSEISRQDTRVEFYFGDAACCLHHCSGVAVAAMIATVGFQAFYRLYYYYH